MELCRPLGKAAEHDAGEAVGLRQDRLDGDGCCAIRRKPVDAGRNRRKRDRPRAGGKGKFERPAVARAEKPILAATSAPPDGPNGMHDEPGRQSVTGRELCVAGCAPIESSARGEQVGAGCTVDRAVDTTAAEQVLICGIDDRVDGKCRNVALDDLDHDRWCQTFVGCWHATPFSAR